MVSRVSSAVVCTTTTLGLGGRDTDQAMREMVVTRINGPRTLREVPASNERGTFRQDGAVMVRVGILARMEAKQGREDEVAAFLEGALSLVQAEPDTVAWYAIRIDPSEFGILTRLRTTAGSRPIFRPGWPRRSWVEHQSSSSLARRNPAIDVLASK